MSQSDIDSSLSLHARIRSSALVVRVGYQSGRASCVGVTVQCVGERLTHIHYTGGRLAHILCAHIGYWVLMGRLPVISLQLHVPLVVFIQ